MSTLREAIGPMRYERVCPRCLGNYEDESVKFCPEDGSPIEMVLSAPVCGCGIQAGYNIFQAFCKNCGTRVMPWAEFKRKRFREKEPGESPFKKVDGSDSGGWLKGILGLGGGNG